MDASISVAQTAYLPAALTWCNGIPRHQEEKSSVHLFSKRNGLINCFKVRTQTSQAQKTPTYNFNFLRQLEVSEALVFFSIIFCAIQTFSMGISMPKSPRATMMPSDSAKILRAQGDTGGFPASILLRSQLFKVPGCCLGQTAELFVLTTSGFWRSLGASQNILAAFESPCTYHRFFKCICFAKASRRITGNYTLPDYHIRPAQPLGHYFRSNLNHKAMY